MTFPFNIKDHLSVTLTSIGKVAFNDNSLEHYRPPFSYTDRYGKCDIY